MTSKPTASHDPPTSTVAMQVIQSLRQGSNLLEGTSCFSAGRQVVVDGAAQLLDELALSGGSAVRWLKGNYGSGKTHTFARIRDEAHTRRWVASYVVVSGRGQGCELQRFEEVYAAIVANCAAPTHGAAPDGSGWNRILDDWVDALKRQAGCQPGADLPTFKFRDALSTAIVGLRTNRGISGSYAAALREFALASVDGDMEQRECMLDWFGGVDVLKRDAETRKRLRSVGVIEPVARKNAKAMLRQMTGFLRYRGYNGIVVLFDEVENVLLLPPSSRRAAYTLVRELIDNVDASHGMTQTLLYFSGTPDLFEGEKGIAEYEALASRVMLPSSDAPPNPAGAVVDLEAFAIKRRDFEAMAARIGTVYRIAYPQRTIDQEKALQVATAKLDHNPHPSPRLWVRSIVEMLDRSDS